MAILSKPELGDFARRLKRLRLRSELSQRDLAEESGVSYAMIAFYECAASCPSADSLAKLADAIGVTMDMLWRGKDTR